MNDKKKIKEVLDEKLVNLTVKEVNELAEILKEEYGIEPAAAAVAVAAGFSNKYPEDKRLIGQIYLDTNDEEKALEIYNNFKFLLDEFEIIVEEEGEIIRGSWFRSLRARIKNFFTKEETEERLKKIEQALELKHLENPQADIDLKKAEAAEKLLKSLNGVKNAAIKIGSLVLIKMTNPEGEENVVVLTLTTEKMKYLDNNPDLLGNPQKLLASLNQYG